jgi:hypothetical protein
MRVWSPHGFLEEVHLAERTARQWHAEGILPPTTRAEDGWAGCYTEVHRTRVYAARQLQRRGAGTLADIARQLDSMSLEAMRELAGEEGEPFDTVRASVAALSSSVPPAPGAGPSPAPMEATVRSSVAPPRAATEATVRSSVAPPGATVAVGAPPPPAGAPAGAPAVAAGGAALAARASAEVAVYAEIALTRALSLRVRHPVDEESRILLQSIAALRGITVELPF